MRSAPLGISRLSASLARRLEAGEHLMLWGPTGSGKTTLLAAVEQRLHGRACARTQETRSLDDITGALANALPHVPTRGVTRKTARARLWWAADRDPVVLLLDDVGSVGTAMKSFLRRLRGGIAGVLLAADVDSPRERARLRGQRLGCQPLRMPAFGSRTQRVLFSMEWDACGLPPLTVPIGRLLIRAARGRPGWIITCCALARDPGYWRGREVRVPALILDTEVRLRTSKRPIGRLASGLAASSADPACSPIR